MEPLLYVDKPWVPKKGNLKKDFKTLKDRYDLHLCKERSKKRKAVESYMYALFSKCFFTFFGLTPVCLAASSANLWTSE